MLAYAQTTSHFRVIAPHNDGTFNCRRCFSAFRSVCILQIKTMASHSRLAALNKSSARLGHFLVKMANAKSITYTYKNKRTGSDRTAAKLEMHLVSETPSEYCIGYVKGSTQQIAEAVTKIRRWIRLGF